MSSPSDPTVLEQVGTGARNVARAVFGTPVFGAQHLWRLRYVDRSEQQTAELSEEPPPVEPFTAGSDVQTRLDGSGPLVMRTYTGRFRQGEKTPEELFAEFVERPNRFAPSHIAGFHAEDGDAVRTMLLGDEFVVELPGPWNGPVRVDATSPTSLTLVTLQGHMEAGHIRFSVGSDSDTGNAAGTGWFQIRSWARAGDRLFERLHLGVKVGKEAQTGMWVHTCDRAIEVSGGVRSGPITVETEQLQGSEIDGPDGPHESR